MTERIYSDEDLAAIRRRCYEAGAAGDELYTVRGGGEKIVRCRDCAHYDARDGFGCSLLGLWSGKTLGFNSFDMGPDGFCAWGERRGA